MNKKKLKMLFLLILWLSVLVVEEIGRLSFYSYEKRIVSQQQEQLLTISKLVGRSIEDFVKEKIVSINYLSENIKRIVESGNDLDTILQSIKIYNTSHGGGINSYYYDFINDTELNYPATSHINFYYKNKLQFIDNLNEFRYFNDVFVGEVYKLTEKSYGFNIVKPVYVNKEVVGVLITKIEMEDIYNKIVQPIKAGEVGYAMVKNSDCTIIMHPSKEQIGYDVLKDRKEKYPELDYEELEKLIEMQINDKEGTYIYYSYWWNQEKLEKVRKIQAFSSVTITNKFWIVAVTMGYEEINGAKKKYLYNILIIALVLIFLVSLVLALLFKILSSREAHNLQVNYLKEINETSENLRKNDVELHQKKRLETIGTFTGGITHEFNNILTPIMGYSEMILGTLSPKDEIYNEVQIINNYAKRAGDVIEQILVFSKDKNTLIQYEVIEIRKIVENAIRFFKSLAPSNIELKQILYLTSEKIYANETQIYQVILNLCINAYNSIKEQGGKIEVILDTVSSNAIELVEKEKLPEKKYIRFRIMNRHKRGFRIIQEEEVFKNLEEAQEELELSVVEEIVSKHKGKMIIKERNEVEIYLPQHEIGGTYEL